MSGRDRPELQGGGASGNYAFIPLPDGRDGVRRLRNRKGMTFAERVEGHLFGSVELRYTCVEPVHVGSGFKRLEDGRVVRAAVRSGGALVIPGSTMKGVLRARFEAMTRSCALCWPPFRRGRTVRVLSQSRPDVRIARLDEGRSKHPALDACPQPDGVCPACALFGFQSSRKGQRARLAISDFSAHPPARGALASVPAQFSPRLHHLGESHVRTERGEPTFVVGRLHGRKFAIERRRDGNDAQDVEVIPAGTELLGAIRFFSLAADELGGFLTAAGLDPASDLKVGGGKGHGFGRIRAASGGDWRVVGADRRQRPPEPSAWRAEFERSEDRWDRGETALVQLYRRGD